MIEGSKISINTTANILFFHLLQLLSPEKLEEKSFIAACFLETNIITQRKRDVIRDTGTFGDVYGERKGGIQALPLGTAGLFNSQFFLIFVVLQPKMVILSYMVRERHTETEREWRWEGGASCS